MKIKSKRKPSETKCSLCASHIRSMTGSDISAIDCPFRSPYVKSKFQKQAHTQRKINKKGIVSVGHLQIAAMIKQASRRRYHRFSIDKQPVIHRSENFTIVCN